MRNPRAKYEQILSAALQVFAESGYHGAQVSRIARTAGVADGTIYLYFKNKEELLISLFQERLGDLVDKFRRSIREWPGADAALERICRIHYTELEQHRDLAYVTQIELRQSSLGLRVAIGHTVKPYFELIEEVLIRGMEERIFRQGINPRLVRVLLFGAMDETVTSWLVAGRKYSLSGQVGGTVDFFLRALRA